MTPYCAAALMSVLFFVQSTQVKTMAPSGQVSQARAAFDRFRSLDGLWRGKSTKGWRDKVRIHAIAAGSAVEFDSFDAHPGEAMATMVYMDGDRLLLTHYCVAKSQPRLKATGFEDSGRTVTFTFLDATNLPSRNVGHMDKVVYHFSDDGSFTEQWSWYQEGNERWMELIEMKHVTGD